MNNQDGPDGYLIHRQNQHGGQNQGISVQTTQKPHVVKLLPRQQLIQHRLVSNPQSGAHEGLLIHLHHHLIA